MIFAVLKTATLITLGIIAFAWLFVCWLDSGPYAEEGDAQ